jgi:hypothetical protein
MRETANITRVTCDRQQKVIWYRCQQDALPVRVSYGALAGMRLAAGMQSSVMCFRVTGMPRWLLNLLAKLSMPPHLVRKENDLRVLERGLTRTRPNSKEHSPSETNSLSATEEIRNILRNPKVHYRVHDSPPRLSILSQMNPVPALPSYFFQKYIDIIHPTTPRIS